MPQVSVIIPTYKHRDFVLATLDSVFAQTFTDYEVIVVNDGSPDDTAEVLRPLVDAGRIRYIEQANAGQAAARNRGIAEAQGEFIALLDDDDLWPPEKLEWQVATLSAHPEAVMVYGTANSLTENTTLLSFAPSGNVAKLFLQQNWIISPGQTLIRAATLQKVELLDPELWGVDDWDLYIRLSEEGEFVYEARVSLYYRSHSGNASKNVSRMYENASRLVQKHQASYKQHEIENAGQATQIFYANQFIQAALEAKRQRLWKDVRPMLWMAVRLQPTVVKERCFIAALTASILPKQFAFCKRIQKKSKA